NASARVPGSCSDLRRAASVADPGFIFVVLQSLAHALGIEQECAVTASCPRIRNHYCHSNFVRIASSLRADMIFGKDRGCQGRALAPPTNTREVSPSDALFSRQRSLPAWAETPSGGSGRLEASRA